MFYVMGGGSKGVELIAVDFCGRVLVIIGRAPSHFVQHRQGARVDTILLRPSRKEIKGTKSGYALGVEGYEWKGNDTYGVWGCR